MNFDGLAFLILAIVGAGFAVWYHRNRSRPVGDEQLREWLSFVRKPSGRASSERLLSHEYDAIRPLFHPALKAEFEEKLTKLNNEFSARAIETTLVFRRQAAGIPLSRYDDEILIREGLRNGGKKKTLDPIGETENDNETTANENEALPGNLAAFRSDAGVHSTDGS